MDLDPAKALVKQLLKETGPSVCRDLAASSLLLLSSLLAFGCLSLRAFFNDTLPIFEVTAVLLFVVFLLRLRNTRWRASPLLLLGGLLYLVLTLFFTAMLPLSVLWVPATASLLSFGLGARYYP